MLESLANLFYEPLFFWGLPLLVVVALGAWRRRRGRDGTRRGETSTSGDDCPGNQP